MLFLSLILAAMSSSLEKKVHGDHQNTGCRLKECKNSACDPACIGEVLFGLAWSSFVGDFPFVREWLGCRPYWKNLLPNLGGFLWSCSMHRFRLTRTRNNFSLRQSLYPRREVFAHARSSVAKVPWPPKSICQPSFVVVFALFRKSKLHSFIKKINVDTR